MMRRDGIRRLSAEAVGTAALAATVVGSGIMGVDLAAGNAALELLANAIATGAVLTSLVLALQPVSGAHFNPAVSLADALSEGHAISAVAGLAIAQVLGAVVGVWLGHLMFGAPLWQLGRHARTGPGQWISEFVATFGLVALIQTTARVRPQAVAAVVGLYIVGAYWFTASTAFGNPALTVARAMTDTFAGIRPLDVPAFVVAELAGALAASVFVRWLLIVPTRDNE